MCTVFKSPDKVKTIGVLSFNYAAQRLFLNKMANAKYKDIRIANKYMWKNTHLWILHILHQLKMSPEEIVAKLFYDYEELLKSDVDTVYIALPNNLHFEFSKKALEYNKNVIVEKPITSNYKEAKILNDLAREKKLFLFEAITTIHLPNYIKVKESLSKIGKIKL